MNNLRRVGVDSTRRPRPRREYVLGDDGDTLLEVLIALLVMSITVVSLLVGFSTAFSASATHRNLAVTDTVLRSVTEEVFSAFQQVNSPVYVACPTATTSYYNSELSSALTPPSPYDTSYTGSITQVAYWSGSNFSLDSSTCTSGSTVPQQLTLQVLGPRGASESTVFVISGSGQIIVAPSVQLNAPTISSVATPSATSGVLAITYAASSNAPSGQTYTAKACLDSAMTLQCVSDTSYASGSDISGLIPGSTYYLTISADPSTGYLSATSSQVSAVATGTSSTPTVTSVTSSTTTTGALVVSYVGLSSPPSGQTYSVQACTDSAMSLNCVSQGSFVSGATLGGLAAGSRYYVTVTANSNGSTPASTSVVASPAKLATVQLGAPSSISGSPSTTTAGVIDVSFVAPTNAPSKQSYSGLACTNIAMSTGCVSVSSIYSGAQITGLTPGTSYYFTISALASSGYLSSTSAVSNGVQATTSLTPPSITSTSSPSSGTATIAYSGSSNAPSGQTYTATACTNVSMTLGCLSVNSYVSGASLSGLSSATTYYVTISANASSGYLSATSSVKSVNVQ
ncbi:MAG: hypothetical protein B7X07_04410 [Actinobacteria bacterium 21-64-8]|nr:MAG: hypothetical protein B7X07_04410 [Actinobacteria bacterium 21-64-8]